VWACLTIWLLEVLYVLGQLDPCDPNNHMKLDDPRRSIGYITKYPEEPLCDMHLQEGWYSFTSGAGSMMPESCPDRLRCGTVVPVWLNGTHPTVKDGIVIRQACGNFENSGSGHGNPCCEHSVDVDVKNCGGFYVYYLTPVPSCPVAYCAGQDAPCPYGKWSPTGMPPCIDAYPVLTQEPELTGPHIHFHTFSFYCEVKWPHNNPEQRLEVVWTFDGQVDPNVPSQVLQDPDRFTVLDGVYLKGHINTNVGCQVRSYFEYSPSKTSPVLVSNTYYAGIQVGPGQLQVDEKDFEKNITISSSIPVICDHNLECCIWFKLDVDKSDLLVPTQCDYNMCTEDWDPATKTATIEVPVVSNKHLVGDGTKQLLINFEEILPAGGGEYHDVFQGHKPNQVQVEVQREKTSLCSAWGDPHIKPYDSTGREFHLFKTGDFVMADIPSKDFQVQARTWACGRVACICGVVIREKSDIIRVDICDQGHNNHHLSPTIDIANTLRDGTVIQRHQSGGRFGIYLPSGVEVTLTAHGHTMNIWLNLPGSYRFMAHGLCGTNDGIAINEYTYPNGTIDDACSNRGHNRHSQCHEPKDFEESWRVNQTDSLFENIPPTLLSNQPDTETEYCFCKDNHHGSPAINCTIIEGKGTACNGCPTITNTLRPVHHPHHAWTKKRSSTFIDVDNPDQPYVQTNQPDVDPNTPFPDELMSQDQARILCENEVKKSQLYLSCLNKMPELITSVIDSCVADIWYSNSTEFLGDITLIFTTSCQANLAQDPNNYITDSNGIQIMKPEYLDDVCGLGCGEHGHCDKRGKCVCDQGWEGEICNLEAGKGPQLTAIRSGPLCDKTHRPCERVFLDAMNLDLTDDLTCQVQLLDKHGAPSGSPVSTTARGLSGFRLACDIPKTHSSSQWYSISVSNDGVLFGNELALRAFDGTCLHCDGSGCTEKTTACHINGRCYSNGQHNPTDVSQVCDITQSINTWIQMPTTPAPTQSTPNLKTTGSPILVHPHLSSRPDNDYLFSCDPLGGVDVPYKVTWMVNGHPAYTQIMTNAKIVPMVSFWTLPTTGSLTCQVERNGAISKSALAVDLSKVLS